MKKFPAESWPYITYCLEVCVHILSHWSATRISIKQKAEVLDPDAAPLQFAKGGLVDVLAELIDPKAAGFELREMPPSEVSQKAAETVQALFDNNGHICLFCMQHYAEVKQLVALGADSIAADPLGDFPDMQQQAVEQLTASYEKFSVKDERIGRKLLKALSMLFESSYQLVVWFLQQKPLKSVGELDSLDVHIEAVRAISRAAYWSAEDAPLLPDFVSVLAEMMLDSIEGHTDDQAQAVEGGRPRRRVCDLTEAEEVAANCTASVLHLLLIDPSPPSVLKNLAAGLCRRAAETSRSAPELDDDDSKVSEKAVNSMMKVMQVFPSSDRVQMNCQHLLTSLLGE
eukprot:TRINITY_DN27045_c0_g1_i2.p1 TRINITY_DN27045_c0_g1~~TRINITY_DN27045_c0_g1_i2.p1  ORF type:complete len:343 (+),score=86.87 TRINITY_DN27045_c0_g1_i2:59-1087(+)